MTISAAAAKPRSGSEGIRLLPVTAAEIICACTPRAEGNDEVHADEHCNRCADGAVAARNGYERQVERMLRLAALSLLLPLVAGGAPAPYRVAQTYVLGGTGGWDYVTYDASSKRLFVSRATHVMVVDPHSGSVVGDIPNTPGVHGIALAPDLRKGFTSNGADGTITVFALPSLETLATIQTNGKNPDGIAYEPATQRVVALNGGSNDATVIDARTGIVVATIPLAGRPEFPAADGRGTVYVNIESTSEIVAIDTRAATVAARFPLGTCRNPTGLSMDVPHRRLFTACTGEMGVVDADTGKMLATLPTGAGTDATAYDDRRSLAFASNGREATVTVVREDDPNHFTVLQNTATAPGARTMALDPASGSIYLVTAKLVENPNATSYRGRYRALPGTFELLVMDSSTR